MIDFSRFGTFDEMLDEMARRAARPTWPQPGSADGAIAIDVAEHDKAYTVRADVPGVEKADVRIEIDGNRVRIVAERHRDKAEGGKGRTLLHEIQRGTAARTFSLPHDIDEATATARLVNGVLELMLPKRVASPTRRLPIE